MFGLPNREGKLRIGAKRKRGSRRRSAPGFIAAAAGCLFAVCLVIGMVFSQPGAAAGKPEIEFWHSLGYHAKPIVEEMVQEYNRTHPGVSVKAVFQGQYEEMELKVLAAAAGRRLPAVVQEQFEFMGKYIEEGILEPVDALVGKADREDILGVFWDLVSVDDPAAGRRSASRGGSASYAMVYSRSCNVTFRVLFESPFA